MPHITVNGAKLYYDEQGAAEETIIFAHGLLFNTSMFDPQVEALKESYRCIRFDFRGQGRSEVTRNGYDMDTLAEDAAALIQALDCAPCHFLGLSMGGFIGMRLAIRHPQLLKSLILLETSADPEPKENIPRYKMLNFIARWFGLSLVVNQVLPIMLGKSFLNDPNRRAELENIRRTVIANDRVGITRAVKGVIQREGVYEQLEKIKIPTLIIVGDEDVATPPIRSERMHQAIKGSKLVVIPGAGHTSAIEAPQEVNRAILHFLSGL